MKRDATDEPTVLTYTDLSQPDALTVEVNADELAAARKDPRVQELLRHSREQHERMEREGRIL